MRIVVAMTLLGMTAACAMPPPQVAAPPLSSPPPPVALVSPAAPPPAPAPMPPPPPPVIATAPAAAAPPPVVAAAAPPPAPSIDYVPLPLLWALNLNEPPPSGRLTLNNFMFDNARVQAVITSGPDCTPREGTAITDFILPLNTTRIIATPPGADICWRRELPPSTAQGARGGPPWTEWARVYTSSGRSLDSRL